MLDRQREVIAMARGFVRNGVFYWSQKNVEIESKSPEQVENIDFITIKSFSENEYEDYSVLIVTLSTEWLKAHEITRDTFYRLIESRTDKIYHMGSFFEGNMSDVMMKLEECGYHIEDLHEEVFKNLYPSRVTLPITLIPTALGLGGFVPRLHPNTLEPGYSVYRFQRVDSKKLLVASTFLTYKEVIELLKANVTVSFVKKNAPLLFEKMLDDKLFEHYLAKHFGPIYSRKNIGKRNICSMFVWDLDAFLEDGQSEYSITNWEYVDCEPLTKEQLMALPVVPLISYAI